MTRALSQMGATGAVISLGKFANPLFDGLLRTGDLAMRCPERGETMAEPLETDHLLSGTGAAGMAFAAALLSHSDSTLSLLDRRYAPGGHWIDAYPFVRLH